MSPRSPGVGRWKFSSDGTTEIEEFAWDTCGKRIFFWNMFGLAQGDFSDIFGIVVKH
jgi:hypothetical protein